MKIIIDLPIDTHYHVKKKNTSKIDIDIILEAIRKGTPVCYGHWINLNINNDGHCDDWGDPYVKCSECDVGNGTEQSDFCPNCGADMREPGQ